jgi:hypothetical protein
MNEDLASRTCALCGEPLGGRRRRFCSSQCSVKQLGAEAHDRRSAATQAARQAQLLTCAAVGCSNTFRPGERGIVPRFCSRSCRRRSEPRPVREVVPLPERACAFEACSRRFQPVQPARGGRPPKYCSAKCGDNAQQRARRARDRAARGRLSRVLIFILLFAIYLRPSNFEMPTVVRDRVSRPRPPGNVTGPLDDGAEICAPRVTPHVHEVRG